MGADGLSSFHRLLSSFMLMKVIKHKLGDFPQLQILPLADLHIGDIHSNGQKIQEWLDYIRDNENCFTILNGDLCDTATRTSIGDVYQQTYNPMQQLEQAVKLFGPIKDKILAVTAGNHEARIYKTDGIDTTQLICSQLGIADRYSPESAMLFIQFGKQSSDKHNWPMLYSIYCVHGSGGGRKEPAKIGRLVDLASIIDADIYLHSHTHLPAIVRNSYFRVDTRYCTTHKVDRLFLNTSSSIDYGGYGEVQSYKPNSLETPLLLLDGAKRGMRAVL